MCWIMNNKSCSIYNEGGGRHEPQKVVQASVLADEYLKWLGTTPKS